ncbi:Activating signal cointegrator 1 complex subunit 2 [Portunus trituberculatus]|uniref:Activating signal cointegrator 1 complex subunit 2 n=1 Tax=Portunus trituberculatus TaxID=210409 RepID=A0A5B7FMP0_PORTR|nr:Activating signal cointegrator 1 complex subunit 2 [Portunus trituberculatus]
MGYLSTLVVDSGFASLSGSGNTGKHWWTDPGGKARLRCPLWPNIYDNTEVIGEPLDELYMNYPSQGGDCRVPALHKNWTQKGMYLKYVRPPPPVLPDGSPPPAGASESWIEQMELMEEDLRGLLRLPHHKFWSQMIYDPNIHLCLESYLSQCPRWYEESQVDQLCKGMVSSLHRLILLIYLRLATPRESQVSGCVCVFLFLFLFFFILFYFVS